ncbi:Cruciform DNA binding protein [Conoideocrella luteorostrata]|uniref:Cruciform DNA binding protein n=1 Tax=Conoideocrella luteorostrata TaxID=1105319 RepID=A0AAJ0CQ96_9HYPO|nr:Cruciform DNA binding protein [Conoideocrella luteorostrata]
MGSYTFKWANPTADTSDVLVTGSFDEWTKSVRLEKVGGIFQKTVHFSEKDASKKIYYKFVVDHNWTINESYPHEPDHEGNVNNFLTPGDLTKSSSAPPSGLAAAPFINTVTPESTTVAEMGKKNNKKNKPAAIAADPAAIAAASAATAPAAEVAEAREAMATPSDVPGGFPVTPSEGTDLEDKTIGINPLPATAGTGNPIKLAPGEKIPDSITSQNVNEHVKLDKASYEKSDALPTAPALSTDLPPVVGTMIPESSLPMGDKTDVTNPTINSAGAGSTTAALAGQVPLEPKVPAIVKDSQDKAGVAPEASAVPKEVQEKAKVEDEIKDKVPQAPATSVGTAGIGTEKSENTGTIIGATTAAAGAAVAAATAAVTKFSEDAAPVANDAKNATASAINNNLPESVKDKLPTSAQNALASGNKDSPLEKVSPQVPKEVKESIAEAGKSPEAAASTSAVQEKKIVESELLKEVKQAPAVDDTAKSAKAPAAKPFEAKPMTVKTLETKPVETKPVETKPVETKPVAVKPVETKPAETKPAETKLAETKPVGAATTGATATTTAAAANGTETKATEPATSSAAANGHGNGSEPKPASAASEKKKKNRISVMLHKLKAKLK